MTLRPYHAVAKINIFLKVTGVRGNYHEIVSRFMRIDSLYDTLIFEPKIDAGAFELHGDFTCKLEENTLYKAYKALQQYVPSTTVYDFFMTHRVRIEKRIPAFGGLGGGSSDAATFLLMCNDTLQLGLSKQELSTIGLRVGADVPFFISEYTSANVYGIGEIVEPYDEPPLHVELFTPNIDISTPRVYQCYREHYYHPITPEQVRQWTQKPSTAIVEHCTAAEANDLFMPACHEYPELNNEVKPSFFFSGSGSSFFKVTDHG